MNRAKAVYTGCGILQGTCYCVSLCQFIRNQTQFSRSHLANFTSCKLCFHVHSSDLTRFRFPCTSSCVQTAITEYRGTPEHLVKALQLSLGCHLDIGLVSVIIVFRRCIQELSQFGFLALGVIVSVTVEQEV